MNWIIGIGVGMITTLTGYIFNTTVTSLKEEIKTTKDTSSQTKEDLKVFGKDYELTIDRIDQNMSAIGKALKVNIITREKQKVIPDEISKQIK